MLRTVVVLGLVWTVVSVAAALLLGRIIALGSASEYLDSSPAMSESRQDPRAA